MPSGQSNHPPEGSIKISTWLTGVKRRQMDEQPLIVGGNKILV